MISRHWGIFSVGLLLTAGVASALLASVTVLPSLLAILAARGREGTGEPDAGDQRSAAANPALMIGGQQLHKRSAKLITCICLLSLLSVCCIGCGISQPPVKTLEQWRADRNRTLPRGD
jgi:hypothetical protein